MNYFTSVLVIIGYFFISILTIVTIFFIIKNRKHFGTELIAYLNLVLIFNSGIIFSTCFLFSVAFFISNIFNLVLWKISLLSGFISLVISSFIFSFFREYRKIQIIPMLLISVLFGLLFGALLLPDSITISIQSPPTTFSIIDISTINYYFNSLIREILIIYQLSFTFYFLYISVYVNINSDKPEESLILLFIALLITTPTIFYILYVIFQYSFFRELSLILTWISNFGIDIMLILKPEIFFILPNKIFSINIYHKSGVLLYSYIFEKKTKIVNNSKIWGNIIVGLNYILSEFIEKADKIDVLQTKKAEIVVDYNNQYGFAVIVITNKKNAILEKILRKFSQEFKTFYKSELIAIQDLNQLINVSEFKDTQQIIEKNFQLYL